MGHIMDKDEQEKLKLNSTDKITSIYSDFMLRIAKFDELVETTYRFLVGFQQELELFRRPQLCNKSKVVDQIIEANQTNRMKRYIEAGSRHLYSDVQNIIKLNSCMQGLQGHLIKAKSLLDELESFKEDAVVIAKSENLSDTHFFDSSTIDNEEPILDEDNKLDYMYLQDKLISYATLMTVIYSMFKLRLQHAGNYHQFCKFNWNGVGTIRKLLLYVESEAIHQRKYYASKLETY